MTSGGIDERVRVAASERPVSHKRHAATAPAPAEPGHEVRSAPSAATWYAGLTVAFCAGGVLFRFAYAEAFATALSGGDPAYHYTLYWLGMGVFLAPTAVRLLRSDSAGPAERRILLVATAVFTYIPRVLRSPGQPLFFDELAHWTQAQQLYRTGRLFQPNVVSIISDYPGLHILTVATRYSSGLNTYQAGLVIGGLSHVLELLAVFVLVRRLSGSDRIAAIAGLCYAVNPGYLFFTAQYAYETLALIFVAWAVALAQESCARDADRAQRWKWTGLTAVVIAAAAVTHHLSSIFLVFILVVYALAHRPWRDWRHSRHAVFLALFALMANALWMGVFGSAVFAYLAPYPRQGIEQVLSFFSADGESTGSRTAFQATSLPGYETWLALAAPPLVTAVAAIGAWLNRRRWKSSPMLRTALVVSACYPLSLPFVLTTAGAPGAHRSWPFTYVLLSAPLAFALAAACSGNRRRLHWRGTRTPARRRVLNGLIISATTILIMALIIGNSGSENNDESMFPGPWQDGTDARTQTPELQALTAWALRTQGGGHDFISDYTTGGVFGAFAEDDYQVDFPSWDLYFYDAVPKRQTLERLGPDRVEFMLVDSRLSNTPFNAGYYFDQSEPEAFTRTTPISPAALDKFAQYPWAVKIYQSQHYALYRLEPAELDAGVYGGGS